MNTKQAPTVSLLFICLGNICRSPAAHAVFCKMIAMRGLENNFVVDSAGIGDWHIGELPDSRMRTHGSKRGYDINHHARQFKLDDFNKFDYIVVMDEENYRIITSMAKSKSDLAKVIRMSNYFSQHSNNSVPDPYYGGSADFKLALDLIEDGCDGLLKSFFPKDANNIQIETK